MVDFFLNFIVNAIVDYLSWTCMPFDFNVFIFNASQTANLSDVTLFNIFRDIYNVSRKAN